jgi:hypothetical protein
MIPSKFIQELGRQFRLDLRDDEARRKSQKEEAHLSAQKMTTASQDGGSGEETTCIRTETREECGLAFAGELLIGVGQKRRTWIQAPLPKTQARKEKEKVEIAKEFKQQKEHPPSKS